MHTPVVAVVQNSPDCPLGFLGQAFTEAGITVNVFRGFADDPTQLITEPHDALVVLGGPMSATQNDVPWFDPVLELIQQHSKHNVPVLGICLGHQLIARALGGTVGVNPAGHTIGLRPMHVTTDHLCMPATPAVMHWNTDVVLHTPPGARVVARTADGAIQAVHYTDTVWGIQGHPEAGTSIVQDWVADQDDALRLGADGIDVAQVGRSVAAAERSLRDYGLRFGAAWAHTIRDHCNATHNT